MSLLSDVVNSECNPWKGLQEIAHLQNGGQGIAVQDLSSLNGISLMTRLYVLVGYITKRGRTSLDHLGIPELQQIDW